jgi:pimeloyl-ACP methyl ester carboxylesterase
LPNNYSVKTESNALTATLDSLGLTDPLDIVAWSYGGFVALDYALDHQEHIRTLTLIEPEVHWVLQAQGLIDDEMRRMMDYYKTFTGDITEEMFAGFVKDAGFVSEGQSPMELPQWEQWAPFRQSLRVLPTIYNHKDDLDRLINFEMPVLLIKGIGSSPYDHLKIDGLSSYLPFARVIELPGGHACHLASMDRFLLELEKFHQ